MSICSPAVLLSLLSGLYRVHGLRVSSCCPVARWYYLPPLSFQKVLLFCLSFSPSFSPYVLSFLSMAYWPFHTHLCHTHWGCILSPSWQVWGNILSPSWQVWGSILSPSWQVWGSFLSPSPWYNCTGWLGVKHQLTYLSPVLFSLKIDNIIKSGLKGSEASLFMDDFALCINAKYFPHAQRLMQLCVNSVQDRV